MRPYIDDWQSPLSNDSVTVDIEDTLLDALKRVGEEMFYDAYNVQDYRCTSMTSFEDSYNDIDYQALHITFKSGYCLTAQIHPSEILVAGWGSQADRVTHLFRLKNTSQISWIDGWITTSSLLQVHEDAFAVVQYIKHLHEENARPSSPRQYTGQQIIKMMESGLISSAYRWLEPNIRINYEYQDEFKKRVVLPSWTWNARKHIESMTQWERTNHIETELARPDWAIGRYGLNG